MKKIMLILLAITCVIGFSVSTYALTLTNSNVTFTIGDLGSANQGEVIWASGVGGSNLLDGLSMYVSVKTAGGVVTTKRIKDLEEMSYDSVAQKYVGRIIAGVCVEASYALLNGKNYLDQRYSVWNGSGSAVDFVVYLVLDLPAAADVYAPIATRPGDYQLLNDKHSSWSTAEWPNSLQLVGGNNLVMGAIGAVDDWEAGDLNEIVASLPFGALSYSLNPTHGNAGAGLKLPPTGDVFTSPGAPAVEARLEIVPEPATMALLLTGLAGLGAKIRRRKRS